MTTIIADATPLIYLAAIGKFDLTSTGHSECCACAEEERGPSCEFS